MVGVLPDATRNRVPTVHLAPKSAGSLEPFLRFRTVQVLFEDLAPHHADSSLSRQGFFGGRVWRNLCSLAADSHDLGDLQRRSSDRS